MIFVTVGTHEQPFNRLVKKMDLIAKDLNEKVIIQSGYSTYMPKYATFKKFMDYENIKKNYNNARIIITHGGPSSFLDAIQLGKIPIVVPRQKKYGEHINNHQVEFCKKVQKKDKNIIVLLDEGKLESTIANYGKIIDDMSLSGYSNNDKFLEKFEIIVRNLFS
ncbi:glycosyltransferase [Ligilactobacillus acidipiscis]|uniref:glycosyltransferase n=1 Tax=Ligilactobacillus acidipiscis TaxID=89059 RepID=UPI0022E17F36|nr:glycosyltransferase [Ligilactobacillus acidipiscis]